MGGKGRETWRKPPFELRRDVGRTLVEQITSGLRQAILTGWYRPGDVLPPMRWFEKTYGVSRIVTNAVLANLATEGLLHPRPGIGAVVLDCGERLWRGSVLVVLRDESGVFYMNVLAGRIRSHLVQCGYIAYQVTVPQVSTATGRDFTLLDIYLHDRPNLAVLIFDDPAIESRLSESGVPYIVVGDHAASLPGAVGSVLYRRDACADEFACRCAAAGVRRVEQVVVAPFPHDDVGPALAAVGIASKMWRITPAAGVGHPKDFVQGAVMAFSRRFGKGRGRLPDLFYFADDHLATGAFLTLPQYGIRIPEDVEVVSWANADYSPVFSKSVARMEMDPIADGEAVAAHAISYLDSHQRVDGAILEPTYRDGETFPCKETQTNNTTRKGKRS